MARRKRRQPYNIFWPRLRPTLTPIHEEGELFASVWDTSDTESSVQSIDDEDLSILDDLLKKVVLPSSNSPKSLESPEPPEPAKMSLGGKIPALKPVTLEITPQGDTPSNTPVNSPKAVKKTNLTTKKPAAKKQRVKKDKDDLYNDVDAVFDMKSPLYAPSTNISHLLNHPKAAAMFEKHPDLKAELSSLTPAELSKASVDFKADGKAGYHDGSWVGQTLDASKKRAAGGFKTMEDAHFAEHWAEEEDEDEE